MPAETTHVTLPSSVPEYKDVIINEIMYAPGTQSAEYIEFYNRSDSSFNLAKFSISDDRDNPVSLSTSPRILTPGSFAVITNDTSIIASHFGYTNSLLVLPWPTLNNSDDILTLTYGSVPVDQVEYDGSWGSPGLSIERLDPAGPSSVKANWAPSLAPDTGTPGQQNTQFKPDIEGPRVIFAEQMSTGGIFLAWSEAVDSAQLLSNISPEAISYTFTSDTELILEDTCGTCS